MRHMSCSFCYESDDKSWIKKGLDYDNEQSTVDKTEIQIEEIVQKQQ
jgi:hypothetical protein